MKRRSGVVHFFATLERGGAEMRTLELLGALGDEAADHRVVTLARDGGELSREFHSLGVETTFVRAKSLAFPWRLRRLAGRSAVFHTHLGLIGGPVLALGRLYGVPVRIAHFRSDAADSGPGRRARVLLKLFQWLVQRSATDIVGVSPGALSSGYRPDWADDQRCRVMLSGLDLSPYRRNDSHDTLRRAINVSSATPVVLHVGRDHEAKNRPRALSIFAQVAHAQPDAHLVFVGRDEAGSHAHHVDLAARLGIADRVHWLGERDDVPALLRSATVTLMTSTREGLPGAVLESVAAGTPVVASDLPGAVYLAEHFPGDIVLRALSDGDPAWASDVVALLSAPRTDEERRTAWERVHESPFDLDRCVDAFQQLWRGTATASGATDVNEIVVHLFSSLEYGGAEMRTVELFRHLKADRSPRQQVVFQSGTPGALEDEFIAAGARVITQRFRTLSFWWQLSAELRRPETTALHLHVKRGIAKPALLLPLAAVMHVPVRVAQFHSDGTAPVERPSRLRAAAERAYLVLIDRLATDIIGVSPASLERGWRSDWQSDPRCRVILLGIDLGKMEAVAPRGVLHKELGLPRETPLVLHVGRGVPLKNRRRAIEVLAATHCPAGAPSPHLVFVGRSDGDSVSEETRRAAALAVQGRVHHLGQRSDIPQLMADAAVLLMTSTQEGMPGVLIEALAVGTPALASDLPGTRFVSEHLPGVRIVSLDECDEVWARALAETMATVDGELRHRLRSALRDSPFDIARAAESFNRVWGRSLLS
jgi:glycosyltransferase involved in cell wall biosynthesis